MAPENEENAPDYVFLDTRAATQDADAQIKRF